MPNIIVTINGEPVMLKPDSLNISSKIEQRQTCSFNVVDTTGTIHFYKGQPVLVTFNGVVQFTGVILSSSICGVSQSGDRWHNIKSTGHHYAVDKRLAAKVYEKETARTIVLDLWSSYLQEEGIVCDITSVDEGPVVDEAVFNYVPVSECLDSLAEMTGCWWRVDENRRLHFAERSKYTTPFTLTQDICRAGSIRVEHSNMAYRNQQVITGVKDLTELQVDVRRGDGVTDTFTTGFAVAREPEIKVIRGSGSIPTDAQWLAAPTQTVGVRGIHTGRDWYWGSGEFVVRQDWNGTKLAANDYFHIEYHGEYPMIIKTRAPSAIAERKKIEGIGTGIVEAVLVEPAIRTREGTFVLASELLHKYSEIGRTLTAATWVEGIQPGHIINVHMPGYGISEPTEMRVESVNTRQDGKTVFYDVLAVEGPAMKSWTEFFKQIVARGEAKVREGIGANEIIILPFDFTRNWTKTPLNEPNYYRKVKANGAFKAGDCVTPEFKPEDRVKYLEWKFDNGVRKRKRITDSSGLGTDNMFTLTYLDPTEGTGDIVEFAWVGGIRVKSTVGTGVIMDTKNMTDSADPGAAPWNKTTIESWQVNKWDNKDWIGD